MKLNRKVAAVALIGGLAGGPLAAAAAMPAFADTATAQAPAAVTKPAPKPSSNYKVTAKSGVNLRSGPGTKYKKIGYLKSGTTAKGTGKTTKGWVQVKSGNKVGWVSASYVKRTR